MHGRFFSNEDSIDSRAENLKNHAVLSFLAMASFSAKTAAEKTVLSNSGTNGRATKELPTDYMSALFYDCKNFEMLEEFEKIWKFLTDSYFEPADPTLFEHEEHFISKEKKATSDRIVGESEKTIAHSSYLDGRCAYLIDGNRNVNFHTNPNKNCIKNICATKRSMVEHVSRLEKMSDENFRKTMTNLYESKEYSVNPETFLKVDPNDRKITSVSPDDLETLLKIDEFQNQLILEIQALKQTNVCESAYLYIRFFVLIVIASEPSVAHEIEKLSDRRKFKDLPLYLKMLSTELENVPFNTHNATDLIKDFVNSAALFYNNAYVKSNLAEVFYRFSSSDK